MSDEPGQNVAGDGAARRQRLLDHLVAAGYPRCEPPVLQPASVFLDLSGEDMRSRLWLTTDADGNELCLRPEFTIPVVRDYLPRATAGSVATFSCLGPVFRQRAPEPGEFIQAGLENFGRPDHEAADAEVLALALEAAEAAGSGPLDVLMGDMGLFLALLDRLHLPPVQVRRIRRGHSQGKAIEALNDGAGPVATSDHSGVLAALEGVDRKGARALVEDLLSIAGISSVGGRSVNEIAERFLEQASSRAATGLTDETRLVLSRFLAISGDPDAAAAEMRTLMQDAKIDLDPALDAFESRANFIAARGLDVGQLRFSAGFGRNLDYYTGFIFEARRRGQEAMGPIVAGGRYDNLLKLLGAPDNIPAVGAAIWCDRLCAAPAKGGRP